MRTPIRHIVRQRLTPSAAEPSSHERGMLRSASAMIATMIGTIITARISEASSSPPPPIGTIGLTSSLNFALTRWSSIHGASTRIPISP